MTGAEATRFLDALQGMWPNTPDMSVELQKMWLEFLEHTDHQAARETVRDLVRSEDFFPTFARFRETCNAKAIRRMSLPPAEAKAAIMPGADAMSDPELSKQRVAELRAQLAELAKKQVAP